MEQIIQQLPVMNGKYYIQSVHNSFLRAHPGGERAHVDLVDKSATWEEWIVERTDRGNCYSLRSRHGTFLSAHPGGEGARVELRELRGHWECFQMMQLSNGKCGILSVHGSYLRAHPGGNCSRVDAQTYLGHWEQFAFVPVNNPGISVSWWETHGLANTHRPLVLFTGDSLTWGDGKGQGKSYAMLLAEKLQLRMINTAICGETTSDLLERLERNVLVFAPRIVVLTISGNDLLRSLNWSMLKEDWGRNARDNLMSIFKRLHEAGIRVLFAMVKPGARQADRFIEYHVQPSLQYFALILLRLGSIFLNERLEFWHKTILSAGTGYSNIQIIDNVLEEHFQPDNGHLMHDSIHPNAEGYVRIANKLQQIVQDMIESLN